MKQNWGFFQIKKKGVRTMIGGSLEKWEPFLSLLILVWYFFITITFVRCLHTLYSYNYHCLLVVAWSGVSFLLKIESEDWLEDMKYFNNICKLLKSASIDALHIMFWMKINKNLLSTSSVKWLWLWLNILTQFVEASQSHYTI